MNKHQLSVSPVVCQAARNLRRVEWLYENDIWRADSLSWVYFWRTQRMTAKTPEEAAAWLPALAFAVSRKRDPDILDILVEFARWSFPEPLPPEALPWRDRLIQVWEQCQVWKEYAEDTDLEELKKSMRLMALVRLDRRVERLPEWLREGRRAMNLDRRERHFLLAALAGWRPQPGDGRHTMRKRGVVQEWVRLWEAAYTSADMDGLIGRVALLHLAETGWLPSGPSPERLRKELHQWVQQWQFWYYERSVFRMVLTSVPPDASASEQQQQDIKAWLELTHKNMPWEPWERREVVWETLTAWQREGIVERGGISRGQLQGLSLLPDLARALECERESPVLWAMAGYIPSTVEVSAHPEATRAVVAHWEALSRHDGWRISAAAWVARWNLLRAGVLTAEEQTRFDADYVKTSRSENFEEVLLALARITPPGTFPLDIWTHRLSDQGSGPCVAAQMAIQDWLVEVAGDGQRRRMRQVLRRAGQEVTGTVVPFVNLPHNVLPDFRRLDEIETALAAGQMPPPPDSGMESQPAPHAVPARLPEAHPRTGPPGITGRTGGSESTPLPS